MATEIWRSVSRSANLAPAPAVCKSLPASNSRSCRLWADTQAMPTERPEGLEIRPSGPSATPASGRPEWLVGAGDVLEKEDERDPGPRRPAIGDVPPERGSLRVVQGDKPEPPRSWSAAASSVPKLSIVPNRVRPADGAEESVPEPDFRSMPALPGEDPAPERPAAPAFRPLDEPWHLVWLETFVTNRAAQAAAVVGLLAVAAIFFWPRHGLNGASLGSILRHPERYQGRVVTVHGEVLESFEVGLGHAFRLRQGRDVVVVYSTLRQPRLHQRVEIVGTVSTGYLDGAPRVAIFEGAAP